MTKLYDMEKFRLRPSSSPITELQFSPLSFIIEFGKSNGIINHEYRELNKQLSAIYQQISLALPANMSRVLDEVGWIQFEKKLRLVEAAYQFGFIGNCTTIQLNPKNKTYN